MRRGGGKGVILADLPDTYALLAWYDENKRNLPWRKDRDGYRVLLSEVMLQQTRVEAVRGYYLRFLEQFPDVCALAKAPLEAVYKAWEGLGYYSRARRLWEAAGQIAQSGFPQSLQALRALPGVGDYTAAAVASICLGVPVCAVDGNVFRVMARYAGIRDPIEAPASKRAAGEAAQRLLNPRRPGDYNQALMELGATVCVPRTPRCAVCPLNMSCDALREGDADALPLRAPKRSRTTETLRIAVVVREGTVLMRKRGDAGLLAGQWEFPYELSARELRVLGAEFIRELPPAHHIFTHREWRMTGALYRAKNPALPCGEYRWASRDALLELPVPVAMHAWRKAALEALR